MAMIQGIDGGVLLQALQAGRGDRMKDMAFQAKQAEAQREADRQKQISGVMGQLFPGAPSGGGVSGQFAPSTPQTAAPTNFGEAFGSGIPAEGVQAPAVAPPTMPTAPQRRYNPEALAQLIALDPETGGKMASAFKQMDEANLKALETKNTALGAAAKWLESVPETDRGQAMQIVLPQLVAAGWSEQEVTGRPLSNQALRGYQAQAMDVDTIIDNELANREFMAGKTVAVPEGGSVANIRPVVGPSGQVTTTAEYVIAPAGVGGGQGAADIPRVNTPSEAAKLAPGTQFYDPNGVLRTVPGGQTATPSGDFRP